jgi:mRNA interferase RelE/StbE
VKLSLHKSAFKFLQHADYDTHERVLNALIAICAEADTVDVKPLVARDDELRARVGKYRIVYTIENGCIIVKDIGSRGQIYK